MTTLKLQRTFTFTFTDKTSYLAYRKDWKQRYAVLSSALRDIKFARWFADSRRGGVAMNEALCARYAQIGKANADLNSWGFYPNSALAKRREQAALMLIELKQAKLRAQEQYLKNRVKAQETVPVATS